jgi:peptidyl-prolyl cis-trans isomerase SurA
MNQRAKIRTIGVFLALAAAGWGTGLSQGAGERGGARVLDEIVAKVNNEIITMTDLDRALLQFRTELEQDFADPQELQRQYEERKRYVLRVMIQNKVLIQKAEELGITSDVDLDVSAYLEELRRESGIPSLEVLDQYFRQRGSSLQEYRQRVREQMITRSLLQQYVYSKITLLTPEVEAYYQQHQDRFRIPGQVHLAEILFLTEDKIRSEVRRRAEEALARIESGEEFEDVARQLSEGPTASRGGDIGTFTQGSMNEALEAVVFDIPVGTHSGIVETDYGFQIVKVLDRTTAGVRPLQEVRPLIAEALYQEKAEPEIESYLRGLYEESYIYVAPKYAALYDVDGLGIPIHHERSL